MKRSFSQRCIVTLLPLLMACTALSWEVIQPVVPAAQPFTAEAPLSPFTPQRLSSETQRRLQQWDALVVDKAWNDAFHLVDELIIASEQEVYTLSKSEYARSIPLKKYLQAQLAKLPAEGLLQYRKLYDSSAEELYRTGIAEHNSEKFRQIINDYFLTSWADDALLALGDMAFTAGDFRLARQSWMRINPLLIGPHGEPIDLALSNLKPSIELTKLAKAWRTSPRPDQEFYYPDTDIAITDVLTRLILCSLQESDLNRAKAELLLLNALAPNSETRLAGQEQKSHALLESLLSASEESIDASDRLGPLVDWQWDQPVRIAPVHNIQANNNIRIGVNALAIQNRRLLTNTSDTRKATPLVTDDLILLQQASEFTAWSAIDGKTVPTTLLGQKEIKLRNPASTNRTNNLRAPAQGQILVNGRLVRGINGPINVNTLRQVNAFNINFPSPGTHASHDGIIFFCTPPVLKNRNGQLYTRSGPPTRLVGFAPQQEGKLVCEIDFQKDFPSAAQYFAGPPVLQDDHLFIALNSNGANNNFGVACYSFQDNRLIWKTNVGSGMSDPTVSSTTPLKIILGNNSLFLSTNCGALISLNSINGSLRWISQYPRSRRAITPFQVNQQPTGCFLLNDRIYVTPSDSEQMLCFDSSDGKLVWAVSKANPTSQIASVTNKTLLLAGEQLEAIDRVTGMPKYLYPESKHSGIRGMGRGVAVADEFFWPTRHEIISIKIDDGSLSRPTISLSDIGHSGANLARYRHQLVVLSDLGMNVLGDQIPKNREPSLSIPHLSDRGLNELPLSTVSQVLND